MHPFLAFLGCSPHAGQLYAGVLQPGLFALAILEALLLLHSRRVFTRLLPGADPLSCAGLGFVCAHSWLVFLLNAAMHLVGLRAATILAWAGTFAGLHLLGRRTESPLEQEAPGMTRGDLLSLAAVAIPAIFLLAAGTSVDFGKAYFPMIMEIVRTDALPGMRGFLGDADYHYGACLFSAGCVKVFGLQPWVADDVLPLAMCWTPFVAYRWMARRLLRGKGVSANLVGLLAAYGTNLRLYGIFLLLLLHLAAGGSGLFPDGWEAIRLFSRDFDLNPSLSLTHIEHLLHGPSSLGLPVYLFALALWSGGGILSLRRPMLASFALLSSLSLFREDLFCLFMLPLALFLLAGWRFPRRRLLSLALALAAVAVLQGGPIALYCRSVVLPPSLGGQAAGAVAAISAKTPLVPLSKDTRIGATELRSTFPVPTMATLSCNVGRKKVPVWHPQVLLDAVGDYGPALLGLPFLVLLFRNGEPGLRFFLWLPFLASWIFILFATPTGGYVLDINRAVPYGLTVLVLSCAALSRWPGVLSRPAGLALVASGLLACLAFPARNRHDWDWYHPDFEAMAAYLDAHPAPPPPDGPGRRSFVFGLNRGFHHCGLASPESAAQAMRPDQRGMIQRFVLAIKDLPADLPFVVLHRGIAYCLVDLPPDSR